MRLAIYGNRTQILPLSTVAGRKKGYVPLNISYNLCNISTSAAQCESATSHMSVVCSDTKWPLGGDISLFIDLLAHGGSRCKYLVFNRSEFLDWSYNMILKLNWIVTQSIWCLRFWFEMKLTGTVRLQLSNMVQRMQFYDVLYFRRTPQMKFSNHKECYCGSSGAFHYLND